jgi:hypothetical protein
MQDAAKGDARHTARAERMLHDRVTACKDASGRFLMRPQAPMALICDPPNS